MSESGNEALRQFFIVVIAGNKQEFFEYAQQRREKVGDEHFYIFDDKFIIYKVERKELKKNLFKVYNYSYTFHYAKFNQNLKEFNLKIPYVSSWETFGTGQRRHDHTKIIDYCKNRWSIENPTTRKANGSREQFKFQNSRNC